MYLAPTRKAALAAYDQFISSYQIKFPKACECLQKDKEVLFTFYDFPAQHWSHLRTTNPIESQAVGEALVAYLQQARPRRSPYREIFLRWYPPFRPLRSSCTISALVGKVLKRARVEVNRPGAHVSAPSTEARLIVSLLERLNPTVAL
jgi:Transposase, Mutator family